MVPALLFVFWIVLNPSSFLGVNGVSVLQSPAQHLCTRKPSCKFLGARLPFYSNSSATFQTQCLRCGDINPNPGPHPVRQQPSTDRNLTGHNGSGLPLQNPCHSMDDLKRFNDPSIKLPLPTWHLLKSLNILARPPTHRGRRAGMRKQHRHRSLTIRPITVTQLPRTRICNKSRTGHNPNNLHPIKCKPSQNIHDGTLRVCVWNAHSIRNKTAILSDYITQRDTDAMFLTETWLYQDDHVVIGECSPPGYSFINFPRGGTDFHGGIGVIYKTHLNLMAIPSPITATTFECAFVTDHTKSILFIAIYRPPPSQANRYRSSEFLAEFENLLVEADKIPGKHVILGDFNIHIDLPYKPESSKFLTTLSSADLYQFVSGPTHTHGHTLDLVIARHGDDLVRDCVIHENLMSDHHAIHFELNRESSAPPRTRSVRRDFRSMDADEFRNDLKDNLKPILQLHNVHDQVEFYNLTIKKVLDIHCPLHVLNRPLRPRAPWYNNAIHVARKIKRRFERRWRKTKLDSHRQAYQSQLTVLAHLIQTAKAAYFKEKLATSNTKDMYRTVHKLLNNDITKYPTASSMINLCNNFCHFFTDKIVKIRSELDCTFNVEFVTSKYQDSNIPSDIVLSQFDIVDDQEIHRIISGSPNKYCSLDPLPTWLLKANIHVLVPYITHIVNSSFSTGTFPRSLCQAIITPILKKHNLDPNTLNNYRPVSNIPFLSKVLEKVVLSRVNDHLYDNHLHQTFQSAYKSNHSTETGLLRVKNDIMRAIDKNMAVLLVALDLSSAFDTIDHNLLIHRLCKSFGFQGSVLHWFDGYLAGRRQRVGISGAVSDDQPVNFGVPQGSVIGPLLFTFYTQPVCSIIENHNMMYHIYADDTQIYTYFNPSIAGESDRVLNKLSSCITDIRHWMTSNKMKLNDNKTQLFVAGNTRVLNALPEIAIEIGNSIIRPSPTFRNLGVVFDSTMSMSPHITSVCQSVNFHLRNLHRIRKFIDHNTCNHAVRSLIISRLDYCNSLLYGVNQGEINRLQKLQNRAARLIYSTDRSHNASQLITQLHWLPLNLRLLFKLLLIVYKSQHGSSPSYLSDLLFSYHSGREGLRSQSDTSRLQVTINTKAAADKAFSIAGPKEWNKIPHQIRASPSIQTFKTSLKTHLFSKSPYNLLSCTSPGV